MTRDRREWVEALRDRGVLPLDAHGFPRDRLEEYAARVAAETAAAPGAVVCRKRDAVAVAQPLSWDTEQLGFGAGRLALLLGSRVASGAADTAAQAVIREAVAHLRNVGVRHLSARVDCREGSVVRALEDEGFRIVDGILKFALDLRRAPPPSVPAARDTRIRDAREEDIPALRSLAASGFVYDRFHNDPVVPRERADRLHAAWVENAVRGRTGCGVLVAETAGTVSGFFILAEDRLARSVLGTGVGTLVLITVDGSHRRRGIARALSLAGAERLYARGNGIVEVGTQIANLPASRVYLDAGFRLVQTSLSLRRWEE